MQYWRDTFADSMKNIGANGSAFGDLNWYMSANHKDVYF